MTSISFSGTNYGIQVGSNRGIIVKDFHLPPVRPETPPSPLSNIPFPRDPDFVRRETLLDLIYEKNSTPGSSIALIGLGGVGKSQLAIEYAHQVRENSPATWIFWVHASNETRFEQSFRDFADQAKIPGRQIPKSNIFNVVENWLRDQRTGKWRARAQRTPPTKPLLSYIPRSPNGSIIITSRTREVASKMVRYQDLIEVQPMEKSEALELLQRKLGESEEIEELQNHQNKQLVDALEFMPLAIVQAASFIRNRAPRYSVLQYLEDFEKNDHQAIKLLKKEAGYLHRDWEAKNSILITWQISFDYIRQTKPSAAELLSLMSFFDRQGIPDSLLCNHYHSQETSKADQESIADLSDDEISDSDQSPDFEEDVTTLRDYSFISMSESNKSFMMHRLIQLTTRAWLKSHGELNYWREEFITTLYEEFPTGEYENWERCRLLFPHVKSAVLQKPTSDESLTKWASLLYRGAWHAWQSDNIIDTKTMALKSRDQRRILLGDDHPDLFASTIMLAIAIGLDGQWEEAERLQMQAIQARKSAINPQHEDDSEMLTGMANLAWTYRKQGRWEEAEQIEVYVMKMRISNLGIEHPLTLSSMAHLAATYLTESRWEESKQLIAQVIEVRKVKFGPGNPDTLTSIADLASVYRSQGQWEQAEQLELDALRDSKKNLGLDHSVTLSIISNLASTYWMQGRWEEAKGLFIQVMEIRMKKLGVEHPDTLTCMAKVASTCFKQGQLEQAENLFSQVMEASKIKLGVDHPDTITSISNLASTYRKQGRWTQAEELEFEVLQISKIKFGLDHPETLISMANIASTYRHQGRLNEAEGLLVDVVEIRKTKLGEDHPDTLTSVGNLALTYFDQDKLEQAENLQVLVMETRKIKLGRDHPDTLTSMTELAFTWKRLGCSTEATNLLKDCLAKQERVLGPNHPLVKSNSVTLLEWELRGFQDA
ncbi:hypothetical protein N7493_007384 [Penicillium malachiteum]|uniref:DUF7779 domain-containing protein n=1 Tax=Penicillium malachiteum TaxID=1324776 RepID=A0AAD6HJV0_9EURO|nr:hypothetical protein N7493_007384 [Penicillium malachiteum]